MAEVENKYPQSAMPFFLSFANQDIPAFVEKKGKDYVQYGEKNDYPYFLIDLYTRCAYHKAIVDRKVSYICGNGWAVDTTGMNTEQRAVAQKMLEQPFGIDDLNGATLRWTLDAELFNGVCIKVSWSKDKKTGTLSYIDMANVRVSPDEKMFYYTSKWFTLNADGTRKPNNKPQEAKDWKVYEAYDPENRIGEQIYYWKAPHPDQAVYALPTYAAGVTWMATDVGLSDYFYTTVETAFIPTHLLNFYGNDPTQEKSDAMERRIKEKFAGPKGARIIVSLTHNKDTAPTVETLQMTDADKQYDSVDKRVEQRIFTVHGVTSPMLFGLKTEGQLGGRSELMLAEELFQNSYITPRQNIIEGIINEIARDFGIGARFCLNKVKRIGYTLSDTDISNSLTPEEKREIARVQLGIKTEGLNSSTPGADLLKAIGSVSPLVANKILESLTPAEVRSMVGLGAAAVSQAFSSMITDADVLEKFASVGHDGSRYEVLHERPVENFERSVLHDSEMEFMTMQFASEIKANQLERAIIDILSKDGTTQPEAIAKAAKSTVDDVKAAIQRLADREIIQAARANANGEPMSGYEVTDKGLQALDEKPAKTAKMKVVYRYGLAPNFKGQDEILPNGRTRDFCAGMIRLSRAGTRWTSEQIFSLDPGEGINPWTQRGGWHTRKDGQHVPVCRHVWIQQLVQELE